MATSQNGYEANNRALLAPFMVGDRKFMFRRGSPGWLLWHCIDWFDQNIKDINRGIMDDWSYAERPIRGSATELSNHASGTAGDVDATRWPLGKEPGSYLSDDQIRRLREHLRVYEGCVRWGGDYTGRKDPMHFEINRDEATCNRVMAKLQQEDDMPFTETQLRNIIQSELTEKLGRQGLVSRNPKVDRLEGLAGQQRELAEGLNAKLDELIALLKAS